jgi:outer membrane protein
VNGTRLTVLCCALCLIQFGSAAALAQSSSTQRAHDSQFSNQLTFEFPQLAAVALKEAAQEFSPSLASSDEHELLALLPQAKKLLNQSQATSAYQLLKPKVNQFAGNIEFDYLLGISALDIGKPGEALLALERTLAQQPDNLQVRAEIARAHFSLKEYDAAQAEFKSIQAKPIPDAARASINRYLDAIKLVSTKKAPRTKSNQTEWTLDWTTGVDSNVNIGSAQSEWLLGDGSSVNAATNSLGKSGAANRLGISVEHQVAINDSIDGFIQAGITLRQSFVGPKVSLMTADAAAGVVYRTHSGTLTGAILLQGSRLDHEALRNVAGTSVQWLVNGKDTRYGPYFQYFKMSNPNNSALRSTRFLVGATVAHELSDRVNVSARIGVGRERSSINDPQFSFEVANVRAGVDWQIDSKWRASASASIENRQYKGVQELFAPLRRKDLESEIKVSAEREINSQWSVEPNLLLTRNRSSIGPNDYRRGQLNLIAKFKF